MSSHSSPRTIFLAALPFLFVTSAFAEPAPAEAPKAPVVINRTDAEKPADPAPAATDAAKSDAVMSEPAATKTEDDPAPAVTSTEQEAEDIGKPDASPAAANEPPVKAGDEKSAITKPAEGTPVPADAKSADAEAAKPAPPPPPTLVASVNLTTQRMTVSENGAQKYSWAISSGTSEYPTPTGSFKPQWMSKMWYSRKYDNAPMPNAVFINGGVAIHATYATSMLGRAASHGCIRLSPTNAKTFYNLVGRHGKAATKVVVHGKPKWSAPAVASRRERGTTRYSFYQQPRYYYYKPQRYVYPGDDFYGDGYGYRPRRYVPAYKPRRYVQRRYYVPPRYSGYNGYGYGW